MTESTPGQPDERVIPSNAEDAKTLKAMESMESTADDASNTTQVTSASAEALGKAMKDLSVAKPAAAKSVAASSTTKVNAADVAIIVEEMEVSKARATDVLRSSSGDVVKALRLLVTGE